jgi:hypothetical protein
MLALHSRDRILQQMAVWRLQAGAIAGSVIDVIAHVEMSDLSVALVA